MICVYIYVYSFVCDGVCEKIRTLTTTIIYIYIYSYIQNNNNTYVHISIILDVCMYDKTRALKTIIICVYNWHVHSCSYEMINTCVCVFVNVHRCCVWMWPRILVFEHVSLSLCVCARTLLSCSRACVCVCIDLSFCPSMCMMMCVLVCVLYATDSIFSHTIH